MKLIPVGLTRTIGRQILLSKKHAPHAMFGLGIIGTVASTVLACRATLKLEETIEDFKNNVDGVKDREGSIPDSGYSRSSYNADMTYVYVKGTFKIVKLYAPAVIVGAASIGALTGSHVTLTRRNAALTAAYTAMQLSFEAYRDRVREELGEEKERELHHAIKMKEVTVDGKKELVPVADPNKWSMYARFFDEGSPNWVKNPELNRIFVQVQQTYANNMLQARGHVFLNEVYDMLGIPHSSAGSVVGWILNQGGDNFVDFGIFEAVNSDFVNGWERSILLDFNVDGVIYNKI